MFCIHQYCAFADVNRENHFDLQFHCKFAVSAVAFREHFLVSLYTLQQNFAWRACHALKFKFSNTVHNTPMITVQGTSVIHINYLETIPIDINYSLTLTFSHTIMNSTLIHINYNVQFGICHVFLCTPARTQLFCTTEIQNTITPRQGKQQSSARQGKSSCLTLAGQTTASDLQS
jgi:hypothetical protein